MKKLLILLSIFFLLSNSNIKPAVRSDDAASANKKQRIELKEEAQVGRSPNFSVKDDKVMKEIASAYLHIPAGISGLILDYCKSKFKFAYNLSEHTTRIESLIALDKTHFVSGSYDKTIKIWEFIRSTAGTPEYKCIQTLKPSNDGHTGTVLSLMKLDDNHFVSGSADSTIKIWEFIPATTSTPMQCRCIKTLDEGNDGHTDFVWSLMKLDNNLFVSGSSDKTIKIWKFIPAADSTPVQCSCIQTLDHRNGGHIDIVFTLMDLYDNHFVSGSADSTIKIWKFIPETSTARCVYTSDKHDDGHTNWVIALTKLDDKLFVSGDSDGTIKIWEFIPATASTPMQCRCIQTLDKRNDGHIHWVRILAKLDKTHFASGSRDNTIKIWQFIPATASTPATCACIQTLSINGFPVSLTRMSNGDLIVGLQDGSIQVLKPVVDIE